jgi:hypothetical protein
MTVVDPAGETPALWLDPSPASLGRSDQRNSNDPTGLISVLK